MDGSPFVIKKDGVYNKDSKCATLNKIGRERISIGNAFRRKSDAAKATKKFKAKFKEVIA